MGISDHFEMTNLINSNTNGSQFPENVAYTLQPGPGVVWDAPTVIKAIIFIGITLCTIFGNLFVLLAVAFRRKELHSSTHYLIANLAFADFLVGVLVMPFLATYNVTGKWYFGQTYCMAWACIHFWLCSASILSITAICLDRYIGVQYPLLHFKLMNLKRVGWLSAFVWSLAGLLSVPALFIWPEPSLPQDDPYQCKINFQLGHVMVVSLFIFYIPLATMMLLYWKIYRIAIRHLKGIREGYKRCTMDVGSNQVRIHVGSNSHSGGQSSSCGTTSTGSQSQSDAGHQVTSGSREGGLDEGKEKDPLAINLERQSKTAKKVSVIVGAFILSYFPFFTAFLIKSLKQEAVPIGIFIFLGWIRYFNSCLNPLIYATMLKPYRKAFRSMYERSSTFLTRSK